MCTNAITGMSDIIRGLSEPNETATAQQIKGQFAVLRLSDAAARCSAFLPAISFGLWRRLALRL